MVEGQTAKFSLFGQVFILQIDLTLARPPNLVLLKIAFSEMLYTKIHLQNSRLTEQILYISQGRLSCSKDSRTIQGRYVSSTYVLIFYCLMLNPLEKNLEIQCIFH